MTLKKLTEKWRMCSDDLLGYAAAERALKKLCALIEEELAAGGEIPLPGIGKLRVKDVPARIGRNPQTGEQIDIPAKKKVALAPAKVLLDRLNA